MKSIVRMVFVSALVMLTTMGTTVYAQWSQTTACPGWNNPNSFTAGDGQNYYQGKGGTVPSKSVKPTPNVLTGETGINWNSTVFSASQMSTAGAMGCSGDSPYIPDHDHQFAIMTTTSQAAGASSSQVNLDPNTGYHLPFVPNAQYNTYDTTPGFVNTQLTRSIRIGDDCSAGGANGAAALYYNMFVTTDNAVLILYYACVVENPGHGLRGDPTFIIRVMQQNASNQWTQISDTLAYMVSSTPEAGHGRTVESGESYGTVVLENNYNTNGWHGSSSSNGYSSSVYFKDWTKVVINLSKYVYQNVRIEVMINDCYYNAHYAYAYIAGECRQMRLLASGCPAGRSTDVTTLQAPRGMLLYEWGASEWGVSDPVIQLEEGGDNEYFTFRTLASGTEAAGFSTYRVQASDFTIRYRPNPNHTPLQVFDSVGQSQTFRCRMTSALDPSKPFTSSLYTNVTNNKPTMMVDTLKFCDGNVRFWNKSFVPGGTPEMVLNHLTQWNFYNNPGCLGDPIATFTGDSVDYQFEDTQVRGFSVRTEGASAGCYSEAIYPIKPLANPKPGMTVSDHVLCDTGRTTITDTTSNRFYREWYILSESATAYDSTAPRDTLRGYADENVTFTRPFSHNIEPIELMVRNGLYYINPYLTSDTIWCHASAYDTVAVFAHPELEVTGDTIVCQGSKTDAYVRAVGRPGCTFEWSRTYGSITGGIPPGEHLQVAPYADTSVYYVRVTSPEGCVAWDSLHAYLVRPQLYMIPEDGIICPYDSVQLIGMAADHYSWTASPADPSLAGQEDADKIWVTPSRTTTYTMVGHGSNGCNASPLTKKVTVRPLPVPRIVTNPDFVDADDPTIVIRDVSPYGVTTLWEFDDGAISQSREVTHTFTNAVGNDSVYVRLTSGNVLNCTVSKQLGIPVSLYTIWMPAIFTPGSEDENAIFRMYTINDYENFHIYIYNRFGGLVFESDNPSFEWDGTYNGTPCQQGAYVYVLNYRKPGANTLKSKSGTITLIR